MRQRMSLASRGERILLLLLAFLTLSGLVLYAWASRSAEAAVPAPKASAEAPADSLLRDRHYVGPPQGVSTYGQKKLHHGEKIDLNGADSLILLRVPGIGPAFAHRILQLRKQLGGYYTVLQLQEVYGVDEDKFLELRPWFVLKTPPKQHVVAQLPADSLPWHPYLTPDLSRSLRRLLRRYGGSKLTWSILRDQGGFSREDSIRLSPYFLLKPAPRAAADTITQPS